LGLIALPVGLEFKKIRFLANSFWALLEHDRYLSQRL
jgi:hypothetical protein